MMSRALKLSDFLMPARRAPVMEAMYNWLWRHAGQAVSYTTLGRAAWGDWGADYAATRDGQKTIVVYMMRLRQRIAATKRPDGPVIQAVGHYGGYRLLGDTLAAWGPIRNVKTVPRQRKPMCPQGHTKELMSGQWQCRLCRLAANRRFYAKHKSPVAVQP